jgi:hypothetical protein
MRHSERLAGTRVGMEMRGCGGLFFHPDGVRNGVLDALRQMELIKCPPAGFCMYHPPHHGMEFGPQCHH